MTPIKRFYNKTVVHIGSGIIFPLILLAGFIFNPVNAAGQINLESASSENASPRLSMPAPQYTQQGTKSCTECHSGEIIQIMLKGPHGNKNNPDTPFAQRGCESCHGPGSFHISRAHGGKGFPKVITFGTDKKLPADKQLDACLHCHAKKMGEDKGMKWQGSIHAEAKMTCSECHKLHSTENAMADKQQQANSCYSCHDKTKKEHPRFEDKGIVFEKLSCWSCHDVHQLQHIDDMKQ